MSTDDQQTHLSRYTLEEQFELYRFGTEVVHPPAIYLAESFAQQGEVVVPFLLRKLEEGQSDYTAYHVMWIFQRLALSHRYDFSAHPETLAAIESCTNSMHNGLWKEPTLEILSEIKHAPGQQRKALGPERP